MAEPTHVATPDLTALFPAVMTTHRARAERILRPLLAFGVLGAATTIVVIVFALAEVSSPSFRPVHVLGFWLIATAFNFPFFLLLRRFRTQRTWAKHPEASPITRLLRDRPFEIAWVHPVTVSAAGAAPILTWESGRAFPWLHLHTLARQELHLYVGDLERQATWFEQFAPRATFGYSPVLELQFKQDARKLLRA